MFMRQKAATMVAFVCASFSGIFDIFGVLFCNGVFFGRILEEFFSLESFLLRGDQHELGEEKGQKEDEIEESA